MERRIVRSRQEFLGFLDEIVEDIGAVKPENDSTSSYVEAAAAWLNDADGFYENLGEARNLDVPDWQLFADILSAALSYE